MGRINNEKPARIKGRPQKLEIATPTETAPATPLQYDCSIMACSYKIKFYSSIGVQGLLIVKVFHSIYIYSKNFIIS